MIVVPKTLLLRREIWCGSIAQQSLVVGAPSFIGPGRAHIELSRNWGLWYRIQHMENARKRVVVHSNRLKLYTNDNDHPDTWIVWDKPEQSKVEAPANETVAPNEATGEEHDSTSADQDEMGEDHVEIQRDSEAEAQSSTLPKTPPLRRSSRISRPPVRYGAAVTFRDSDTEFED
jgi:hypothetical protein